MTRNGELPVSYVPAKPEGASRAERDKLVTLHRDADKGGLTLFYSVTEIHPIGG